MLAAAISAASSLAGGWMQDKAAKRQEQLQKDFAQQGIRWKVADAKAAGIHPLAALGASTTSYSPVSVGGGLGGGLASAGQDIARAVDATRTQSGRIGAYEKTIQDLNVRRMGLENELLGSQIAKVRQAGSPPPMPSMAERHLIEGSGDTPLVKTDPLERYASDPARPHQEAAAVSEVGHSRTPTGWAPIMSKDAHDRLEEDTLSTWGWHIRNKLGPTLSSTGIGGYDVSKDGPHKLGPNEYWWYNPIRQEYQRYRMKPRWWGYKHERF